LPGLVRAMPLSEMGSLVVAAEELTGQMRRRLAPSARPSTEHRHSEDHVTVSFDGYLADGLGPAGGGDNPAARVAEVYRREGPAGVERLEGSFVIQLADARERATHVWTDRAGSRPVFWAKVGDYVLIAPEVKCFAAVPGVDRAIVPGSLASMLLNAALMDEHTYWWGVRLLGPASRLTIQDGAVRVDRYWRRRYCEAGKRPTTEQVQEAYTDAVARHVSRFRRPVVALSGGYDSRAILAACRRAGLSVDAVTWGVDGLTEADADFQTGRQVAAALGVHPKTLESHRRGHSSICGAGATRVLGCTAGNMHTVRLMRLEEFPRNVERVVWLTDGLAGHVGAHPEGDAVARELAEKHDALIVGNHLLDGGKFVRSLDEGLHQAGLNFGRGLSLLRCLLRRGRREEVVRDYLDQRRSLLDSLGKLDDPNEVKDVLYWRTRCPRLIGSQAAVYRQHLEYVSPLLDARVSELDVSCTAWERADKHLISERLHEAFPEAYTVPVAVRHSRADWRRRLDELGPTQRYIVQTLLEPLRAFDEWFDPNAVRAWLGMAVAEAQRADWPAGMGPLGRLAWQLRTGFYKHTVKARRVINLLTLKLWFSQFG